MIKNSQKRLKNDQNTLFTDFINCFRIVLLKKNISQKALKMIEKDLKMIKNSQKRHKNDENTLIF